VYVPDAAISAGAALSGVLLTGAFGLIFDLRRRKYEDRRRWHDARRRAYAEFLYASRFAFAAACSVAREAAKHGVEAAIVERDLGFKEGDAGQWTKRANEASAEVLLIASEPMRAAAEELLALHRELAGILKRMLDGGAGSAEEVLDHVRALDEREAANRHRCWMAARAELRVDV
jgi:hypothetical protein